MRATLWDFTTWARNIAIRSLVHNIVGRGIVPSRGACRQMACPALITTHGDSGVTLVRTWPTPRGRA